MVVAKNVKINTENLSRGAERLDPVTETLTNAGSRISDQVDKAVPGFGTGPVAEMLHTQLEPGARQMANSVTDLAKLTGQQKVNLNTSVKGYTATNDENNSAVKPASSKGE
jgi:hypothetical protein